MALIMQALYVACSTNICPLCLRDSQASVLSHQDGNECQFPSVSGNEPAGGGQLT